MSMRTYDWIVIGGGITGSALSYELAKQNFKVLLLEKDPDFSNATRYSYGGLAYWSGTDELSRKLCQEGIEIHRNLSEELGTSTEFRDIDLMLTINADDDPETIKNNYQKFEIQPQLLTPQEACQIEPLLNPQAISGVLKLPHGHIHPQKTNEAYQQAFMRLGGEIRYEKVTQLLSQDELIKGVITTQEKYYSQNTVCCAGGFSRYLLKKAGITINICFTHAQVILTPPVEVNLRTLIMPAVLKRLELEETLGKSDVKSGWNHPTSNLLAEVIEPGAIQFQDGHFCLGQISQICTDPLAEINLQKGEYIIRQGVGKILPSLENLPGKLHHCLVAFSPDSNFLVGKIRGLSGLYLFSGFTSTLVFAPPLARHFVNWVTGETNLSQLGINFEVS